MAAPLVGGLDEVLPAAPGWGTEAFGGPFLVGWVLGSLAHPAALFQLPIFHPEPLALAYTDHLIGEALLAFPLVALTGSLAAGVNGLVLFSFVASAWALYRLARLLDMSRPAAALAGFLFAFAPFRYSNLTFLNQIQTQMIPLGLFFAVRFARKGRRRDLAGVAATLVAQSYLGWYDTMFLGLAVLILGVHARLSGWWRGRVAWGAIGVAATVGAVLVLPVLLPYLELRRMMGGYERTLGMAAMYSADLLDYLRTDRGNWLLGRWPALAAGLACCPGLLTVPLALLGLGDWSAWLRREAGAFLAIGVVAFVLSLGPVLHVAGRQLPIPLPYAALYYTIPGVNGLRGPARLAVLVLVAACVLAALGYDRLRRRVAPAQGPAGALLFAAALGLAALSSASAIATVPFPRRDSMPPAYEWLARRPGRFAILDLPVPATESEEDSLDAVRQFYILYHRRPRLDGVSGFVPPAVRRLRRDLQRFPDDSTRRELAERGARYLVVHLDELDPGARAEWTRVPPAPGLHSRARFGPDLVVELEPSQSQRRTRER